MDYLDKFYKDLEKHWKGSLVSVSEARAFEKNAKKFLSLLAQQKKVQRVTWGWYWIPTSYKNFFDFLVKDKHFKALQKQTAASVWNGDFIHREFYTIAVKNQSYGRALKEFSKTQGWNVSVETRDLEEITYQQIDGLFVESLEDTIIDCLKEWAFVDALAVLQENYSNVNWQEISKHYWERIPKTNLRVGSVLKYGVSIVNQDSISNAPRRTRISDAFIKRQVEEAAEKVMEFV